MNKTIWTVGHSTRTIDGFIGLISSYGIEAVLDVRTVPRSRKNPQFNKDSLEQTLPEAGIEYMHQKDLGGLRHPAKDSVNTAWRNDSFRGFADYMQTLEFEEALTWLIEFAKQKYTVIMCAEILPWRCHRSLIADALLVNGFEVVEIFEVGKSRLHKLTSFAVVKDGKVTYPGSQDPSEAII
ncbi:MAG: DUF488 domain-containing protein [Armatimonadota bacterium]